MRKLNVYLASSAENRTSVSLLASNLCADANVTIVGDWWCTPPVTDLETRAVLDFSAINTADLLVVLSPGGYGTSSEIGYALAQNKPVVYWTYDTSCEDAPLPVGLILCRCKNDIVSNYFQVVERLQHYGRTLPH